MRIRLRDVVPNSSNLRYNVVRHIRRADADLYHSCLSDYFNNPNTNPSVLETRLLTENKEMDFVDFVLRRKKTVLIP